MAVWILIGDICALVIWWGGYRAHLVLNSEKLQQYENQPGIRSQASSKGFSSPFIDFGLGVLVEGVFLESETGVCLE